VKYCSYGYVFQTLEELESANAFLGQPQVLRERMERDGYLYLANLLDPADVMSAREQLLTKLWEQGFVDPRYPLLDAISFGKKRLPLNEKSEAAGALRTLSELEALSHHPKLMAFFEMFLGGEVLSYNYTWIRAARIGEATGCHYDHVYMGRGTDRLYTSWIPLGDVPRMEGPLAILAGSNHFESLIQTYGQIDVDRDGDRIDPVLQGWLTLNPNEPLAQYGGRWLTTDFHAGDVLIFTPYTLHCALDNRSTENRIRLSIDIRKQRASEPADPRWVGPNPSGHVR